MAERCDFKHPHPEHPCGRRVVDGVTVCEHCGNTDGSPECDCWTPATVEHADVLSDDLLLAEIEREEARRG